MKTVKIKNRSTSGDIRILKVYHTFIDDNNLLTTAVSSSGVFTGEDLSKGINFQVDDHVDQFVIQNLQEAGCEGDECNVCTNIGSGSISGEFSSSDFTYSVQPGRFGTVTYDGQFSRTISSSNDIDLTAFTHNHTAYGSVDLTVTPTSPFVFEGWYDNVNRTGTPLSTNSTVTITEDTIDGNSFHSTNWYVKYENNEPLFKLNAADGDTITAFHRSRNENRGAEEIAKFYFSDLDGDTLTVSLSPDLNNHFSLTQYTDYVSFQQTTSSLDYETITEYSMSISVSDGQVTTLLPITIDVIDNLQPTVGDQSMPNFGENGADGAIVGQIASSDPEDDTITFYNINLVSIKIQGKGVSTSLYSGTGFDDPTNDAFDISATGEITKKAGSYLNHRLVDEYVYQVTADDEYNDGTSTGLITINVIPDAQTVTIADDGDNLAYVVETALAGDPIYDDSSGNTGSLAVFTANLPVTWSVNVPHKVSINNSGELSVSSDILNNYNVGDTFNIVVTGTSSIGRTHDLPVTVNITPDIAPATITGLGTSSLAYVIESALENDSIYLSSNGYSGTTLKFESNQTPITWSITPNPRLEIDASGYVTLGSNLSGSAFFHPQTVASQVVATNQYGATSSLDFTLQITENTAPDIIFDNHLVAFDTNYAIAGATLVTASFNDIEGDNINHDAFSFNDPSGQLTYQRTGDVYHISALNTLSASAYSFDIGIEDEHGFSNNEETHTINIGFAQNYPPTITYSNHAVNLFSNLAVSGATLVTASISDTEGDPINYDSFTLINPSGELNAVQDSRSGYQNIFYIQANQTLTALDYEFTASVADNHAFGTSDHSFTLQGSSTGTLRNNSVFIVETGLTGLGYESTKGFGSGPSASLDVIYSPNVGGQVVQAYSSTNPAVVVDSSGNLTLGVDMSTTTSGSGDTYTSDISFTDQYGNVGTGVVNVEVTYPNSGSYLRYEVVPQSLGSVSGSIDEDGLYNSASFNLYAQYVEDGTKVAFKTGSVNNAVINEDYTLSDTEFEIINQTGSIILTAINDQIGEQGFEAASIVLQDYSGGGGFPYYDSAGNIVLENTSNPEKPVSRTAVIQDTSRSYISLVANTTTVNEGGSVVFTLTSQNVTDGTEVLIEYPPGSSNTATKDTDFTMSSDRFIISSNTATLTATVANDLTVESTEYFRIRLQDQDSAGNYTYSLDETISIINVDTSSPVITVTGDNPYTHEVLTTYTDAGATASDTVDGNLTTSIVVTNNVDDQVSGSYTVVYDVSDSAGNTTQATRTVNVVDTTVPVITLIGTSSIQVYQGQTYSDAGATAVDSYEGNITSDIVTTNPVNTSNLGTYTVRYNVDDASGNSATEVTRTVTVVANNAPVISITTDEFYPNYGDTFGNTEALVGVSATDTEDGDITADIVVTNPVDTTVAGEYTVRYNVTDSVGAAAVEKTASVLVIDSTPPVITLVGDSSVDVNEGSTYNDAGATAIDDFDGNITANIVVSNPVDTSTPGTYTVTYNVSDAAGNAATEVVRTVNVLFATLTEFSYGLSNYRIDFEFSAMEEQGSTGTYHDVSKDSISGAGTYSPNAGSDETWSPVNPIVVNRSQGSGTSNIKKVSNNGVFDGYYTWHQLSGSKGGAEGVNDDLTGGARSVDLAHSVQYSSDIDNNPPSVYSFDYQSTLQLSIMNSYTVQASAGLDIVFGAAIYNSTGSETPPEDLSSGWTIYKSFGNYTNADGVESTPGIYQASQIGDEVAVFGSSSPLIWIKPVVGFFHPSGSAGGES